MRLRQSVVRFSLLVAITVLVGVAGSSRHEPKATMVPFLKIGPQATSAGVADPGYGLFNCQVGLSAGACYDPYQMRHAYKIDALINAGFDGRRLARRIRRVRGVGRGLGEGGIRRREAAIHLVGGDVVEAEVPLARAIERAPIAQGLLEKRAGAGDIRFDEGHGIVNRAVHVRLGGQMDHALRPVLAQNSPQRLAMISGAPRQASSA